MCRKQAWIDIMETQEPNNQGARQLRLQRLHNELVQFIIHEGRFVSERTSIFLLFNSIFFTGFLLLRAQINVTGWALTAGVLISIFGILISVIQIFLIGRNIAAANFWRSTIRLIEEDNDFWWPRRTGQDRDLDFFSARSLVPCKAKVLVRVGCHFAWGE